MLANLTRVIFKRTSTMLLFAVTGAYLFERAVDVGCGTLYDKINEGKLWKHIKDKYE